MITKVKEMICWLSSKNDNSYWFLLFKRGDLLFAEARESSVTMTLESRRNNQLINNLQINTIKL